MSKLVTELFNELIALAKKKGGKLLVQDLEFMRNYSQKTSKETKA